MLYSCRPEAGKFDTRERTDDNRRGYRENAMKRALIVVMVLGLAVSLGAQSLVELAKREKERRAQFQGRHAPVITRRELALVKKTGAIEVIRPEGIAGDETAGAGQAENEVGLINPGTNEETAGQPAAENAEDPIPDTPEALADQLRTVDELVASLTDEMNALRQRYESQDAMVPGYVLQEQLDVANQRLARAQARQSAIEAKMKKMGLPVRKLPGPTDR
jgi:hypothetical protein